MKIRDVRSAGLRGATPEGGWSTELKPEDCVHTLVVVHTDEGLTGLGSVFTNDALVRAAIALLEPLWRGEHALEPQRVSEKLHQHTFWTGRGGSVTHAIRASTSRCGISSARRRGSPWAGSWGAATASASPRTPRS